MCAVESLGNCDSFNPFEARIGDVLLGSWPELMAVLAFSSPLITPIHFASRKSTENVACNEKQPSETSTEAQCPFLYLRYNLSLCICLTWVECTALQLSVHCSIAMIAQKFTGIISSLVCSYFSLQYILAWAVDLHNY